MSVFLTSLATQLHCNVFAYDYSGYGLSSGWRRENNLYTDIEAVYRALRERFGIDPANLILYGQSIGTVPTVDLASKHPEIAGVVLHSPLASGLRVLKPGLTRTYCCDPFPSIAKISDVHMPTLIIHGTEDEVIAFSHGVSLHEACPGSTDPFWVHGAGHNDVELYNGYLDRLQDFLDQARSRQPSA
ncbi:uncharacterized protein MONBRDRAFT_24814 [Monosiga brevicollis MX1]|uniref:AB hydrolase-1 domain-containing protein n=1 Tax=Monosiga brevicollis TaxID=81824 RepID=A9UXT6_MONBE|nr:uncharacterized protein MONBRDRAFT_24814 [Monosiga brevicollis MX1]EDQ89901.1 predicted protein [Monosiga brevicollis MX1]|eukprot:XP_001745323.1 hypothetical protein [Monosiga brevicollis MX1]